MKTAGIIAEYNPFHNGHSYQLGKAKELSGADFTVVVMSPDFVQRGEPALTDKYSRTEMALAAGADLVIELPVCYACGSAEYFAEGSIALLHQLGCVDVLSFGCETDQTVLFSRLADVLLEEPEAYRQMLRRYQKQGMTFPKAREAALLDYLKFSGGDFPLQETGALLSGPNNILGLEYVKALKKLHSSISLLPIPRQGSGYHSLDFDREFCSASAVREKLSPFLSREAAAGCDPAALSGVLGELAPFLPETSLSVLKENALRSGLADLEQFSSLLHYRLLSQAAGGFTAFLDVTPDLSDRILRLLPEYKGFRQFVSLLKTRQITEARIRRALLHILLNIGSEETENFRRQGTVFYARILGFRREAGPLLHSIKENSSIPMITKLANAKNILSGPALQMLTQDVKASHIYQLPRSSRCSETIRNEYTCSPVILSS